MMSDCNVERGPAGCLRERSEGRPIEPFDEEEGTRYVHRSVSIFERVQKDDYYYTMSVINDDSVEDGKVIWMFIIYHYVYEIAGLGIGVIDGMSDRLIEQIYIVNRKANIVLLPLHLLNIHNVVEGRYYEAITLKYRNCWIRKLMSIDRYKYPIEHNLIDTLHLGFIR